MLSRVENFQLPALVEKMKPVVVEIQEFESLDSSLLGILLEIVNNQDCKTRNEFNNDQIEYSTRKPKFEILHLEVKSMVMEK